MVKRVAINGFGRIGRMALRAGIQNPEIEFIACNDLTDKETLAYLLEYDSAHGIFDGKVSVTEKGLLVDGKEILVFAQKDPENLPWKELDIDVVIESTGFFRTKEGSQKHITAGAKKVIISAPAKSSDVKTIVMGVNEHIYDPQQDHILSNASCTTNCLAPLVKVLDDNYGVERGFMTTVHAITGNQRLVDAPSKDKRRGRAAAHNMVPTTTGAAKAVTTVIPHLQGKLDGMAIRVPILDGSITDFTCILKKEANAEEIKQLMKNVAQYHMKGVLEYQDDPIVSSDIVNNPHSSIFDADLTKTNATLVKVVAWYDNEWGYSNRLIDMIQLL